MMAIANREQFWQLRTHGTDPTNALGTEHEPWVATGSGASATGGAWTITDQNLTFSPTSDAYTIWALFKYNSAPSNGEVLLTLSNLTRKVEIRATSLTTTLDVVGASTETITGLDLTNEETVIRLTIDSSGAVKAYKHEIIEDDSGTDLSVSITGTSGSFSRQIKWGNTSGNIAWFNVFASTDGAFSPDELSHNEFVQDSLFRSGFKVIDLLQNSPRPYLKTLVDDSAIVYGYDISNQMLSRIPSPSIHVMIRNLSSEDMTALGGHRLDTRYDIECFIVSHGTDYKNAYRKCINIIGDVFDEIMTNYGLDFNHDSIVGYRMRLNSKVEDDDHICAHTITFNAVRRMHLQRR